MSATARHRFAVSRATLRLSLVDADLRAGIAEQAAVDASARAEQAETALAELQARHEALQDRQQQLVTELSALRSKLMRGWYGEARITCAVSAPADDPESAFYSGEETQETRVAALLDQPAGVPAIGAVTPVQPIPPGEDGAAS